MPPTVSFAMAWSSRPSPLREASRVGSAMQGVGQCPPPCLALDPTELTRDQVEIVRDKLKIIGVGVGRTGTLSLKVAVEQLGFGPCFHGSHVLDHPDRLALWHAAAEGKPVDWNAVFAGYQ